MGAVELKFDGTLESSSYLKDFECPFCNRFITDTDIAEKNYRFWVSDYANDVNKKEFFGERVGRQLTAYSLEFWLKSVEHEVCPSD